MLIEPQSEIVMRVQHDLPLTSLNNVSLSGTFLLFPHAVTATRFDHIGQDMAARDGFLPLNAQHEHNLGLFHK